MKTIKINKNDVIYLNYARYRDSNGNTYNFLFQSFIVRKNQRLYFSDLMEPAKLYKKFYGYGDIWQYAKRFLNENTSLDIHYFSDFPGVIVSETWMQRREFTRLIKSKGI
jgi:hypothetical protein